MECRADMPVTRRWTCFNLFITCFSHDFKNDMINDKKNKGEQAMM